MTTAGGGKLYINCVNPGRAEHGLTEDEAGLVYCFSGCAVVAMCGYGGSGLAAAFSEADTPDVGEVISAAPEIPIRFGTRVYLNPLHGKHIKGFAVFGRSLECEVRILGRAAVIGGGVAKVPWWRSIVATDQSGEPRATWDNVIIDRGEIVKETEGGILLPEAATYRPSKGVVVSIGEHAARKHPDLKVGSVVYYIANSMIPMRGLKVGGEYKNWGVITSDGILCEVLE